MRNLLAMIAVFGLGACSRTEIVLGVATDIAHPGTIDDVKLEVLDQYGAPALSTTWALAPSQGGLITLPGTVGIVPSGDPNGALAINLYGEAVDAQSGQLKTLVSRRAKLHFLSGHTLFLRMTLVVSCIELEGLCPAGEWCTDGMCAPIEIDPTTLPTYQPGQEMSAQCGDPAEAMANGLAPPMLVDCPPGQVCVDFTCINGTGGPVPQPDLTAPPDLLAGDDALAPDLAIMSDMMIATPDDASPDGAHTMSDMITRDLVGAPPPDFARTDAITPSDLTMMSVLPDAARADAAIPDAAPGDGTVPDLAHPDLAQADLAHPDFALPDFAMSSQDLALVTTTTTTPRFDFISPLPSGAPITAIAVDTASNTDSTFWAVTSGGDALRNTGGALGVESTPALWGLNGVSVGSSGAWACGNRGAIVTRSGNGTWSSVTIDGGLDIGDLFGIQVVDSSTVLAVGGNRAGTRPVVARAINGTVALDTLPNNVTDTALAVTMVDANHGAVVGNNGLVLILRNGGWAPIAGPTGAGPLTGVYGVGGGMIIVDGGMMQPTKGSAWKLQADETTWTPLQLPTGCGPLHGLVFANNQLYTVADKVGVMQLVANAFVPFGPQPAPPPSVIAAAPSMNGSYFAVAGGGAIFDRVESDGQWVIYQPTVKVFADGKPWTDGNGTLVMPSSGVLVTAKTSDLTKWTKIPVQADDAGNNAGANEVFSQVTFDGSELLAVGNLGVIVATSAPDTVPLTTWFDGSALNATMTGVWAADKNHVFVPALRTSGAGVEFTNTNSSDPRVFDVGTQLLASFPVGGGAVFGFAANDVFLAVNDDSQKTATVYHYDGSSYTALTLQGSSPDRIFALWGTSASDLWAVGEAGGLYHTGDGQTFAPWSQTIALPTVDLHAVGGTTPHDVFVAGDGGTVLQLVKSGGTWQFLPMASRTTANINGLVADSTYVFIDGQGQVLDWKRTSAPSQ